MNREHLPSVSEVQAALGPLGEVTTKLGEETFYTYVGGNIEDWVPRVRDLTSTVNHGYAHQVKRVLSVWTEENRELITFAITNSVGGKHILVNSYPVQTLAATASLAIQLRAAQVGTSITDGQTGIIYWVANAGGGKVLDYEECKEKQERLWQLSLWVFPLIVANCFHN